MPASPLDGPPFRGRNALALQRIVDTVRSVLDPDVVDLEYVFEPQGQRYRWRMTGDQVAPLRIVRTAIRGGGPGILSAPFAVPGLVRGVLALVRGPRRPWTGAETLRFEVLRPMLAQLLEFAAALRDPRGGPPAPRERGRRDADAGLPRPGLRHDPLRERGRGDAPLRARRRAARRDRGRAASCLCTLDPAPRRGGARRDEAARLALGRPPLRGVVSRVPDEEEDVAVLTLRLLSTLSLDDVRTHLEARGVSGREAEVVAAVLEGLRNAEIARRLFISEYTVKDHLKHVFSKLGVASRGELLRALDAGPGPLLGRVAALQTPAGGVPAPSHPQM